MESTARRPNVVDGFDSVKPDPRFENPEPAFHDPFIEIRQGLRVEVSGRPDVIQRMKTQIKLTKRAFKACTR